MARNKADGEKVTKLLVAIPATAESHLRFRGRVVDAIKKALADAQYDLSILDNSKAGYKEVVKGFNKMADKVVEEHYDYVWFVEADVVVPSNAFTHLISQNVDVASGVVPYHHYTGNPSFKVYKDLAVAGYLNPQQQNLRLKDVENKILGGDVFAGTGCILVKREVFESELRFIYKPEVAGHDVLFWKDVVSHGFKAVIDGYVICEHLNLKR